MRAAFLVLLGLLGLGVVSLALWDMCERPDESASLSVTEKWNKGVELYCAGDVTNALDELRPLVLTKRYGARAAELVAAIACDRAHEPGATNALAWLEEAATDAQLALRAHPGDARARRNFARAVSSLPELRETAHINAVLAAAQGQDPGARLKAACASARTMMGECAQNRTNTAVRAIAQADSLSRRAETLADAWLPVKALIVQSVTNESQAASIAREVDAAREKTQKAASELEDLSDNAYASLADVESDLTRFYKLVVLPPGAMREDLVAQSNAWQDVEAFNGRSWQQDALDFTRAFRAKLPAWAAQYEQQAQADTNMPPLTAETLDEISALSTQLEKLQIACVQDILPPQQEEAISIIERILGLLPPEKGGGAQGNPEPQSGGEQNKPETPCCDDETQSGEDSQDQKGEAAQDEESSQEDAAQGGDGEDEGGEDDKFVDAVLRKAQERSDEHEAEKKARTRFSPRPPNERDW